MNYCPLPQMPIFLILSPIIAQRRYQNNHKIRNTKPQYCTYTSQQGQSIVQKYAIRNLQAHYFTHTTRAFCTKRAPSPPEGICCQKRYNGSYSNLQIARRDKGANSQLQGYHSAPSGKNDPDNFGCTKFRWHLVRLVLCCEIQRILRRLIIC